MFLLQKRILLYLYNDIRLLGFGSIAVFYFFNLNMKDQEISFKRWTCKSFGQFANPTRKVRIGLMGIGCSLLTMIPQSSFGQSDSSNSMQDSQLSEIEVKSQRQQVYSDLARIVSVVSKEEIASAPVHSLDDLLRYVSGVDVRQRGANGVQADISVRGGTFDQVLILLNGVNISDPQTGHYSLDVPVELSAIDRIEILQGPGSRVLGPNAFSGAINIVTGTSKKGGIGAEFVAGDNKYLKEAVSASVNSGKVTGFAAISRTSSDGYMDDTDFDMMNIFGQIRCESKLLGNINVQGGSQNKKYGAYGFYSAAYPNEFEHTRTFFSSVSGDKRIGAFHIEPKLYWRQHHDRFELFRDNENAPAWYKSHNYHQTDVAGAALNTSYFWLLGKTSVGVDYRYEHIYSNALGEATTSKVEVPFSSGGVYFTKEKTRKNLNFFVEHAVFFKKLSASVGGFGNYSDDFGTNYYFGGDMGYAFTRSLSAFATVNQSLRLPTFTDLYISNSAQQGDPNLKPEKALTYEFGLKYKKDKFNASLSSYYREGTDVIDWVKFAGDTKFKSMNHANINAWGGEAAVEYLPGKYVQRLKLSYSYLDMDQDKGDYVSKYALDFLKHKVALVLDHQIYKTISACWRVSYQEREGTFVIPKTTTVDTYSPFFLTDLRVQWVIKKFTLFGEASNLFDEKYADYGGVTQAGRWIKAGMLMKQ